MKFAISLTIDADAKHKSGIIGDLSQRMKEYFSDKHYGIDLQDYVIGFICVLPMAGSEHLFKAKKPVYVGDKTTKNRFTGENQRLHKLFIDSIALNHEEYEEFVSVSDTDSRKMLAGKILDSLSNLDKLPKKVKDFDKERFKADVYQFFRSNGLI